MSEKETIQAHLKAIMIHDANNTVYTVKECAEFLKCHERTVLRCINSKDLHNKILAYYDDGWRIPKLQFMECVIKDWIKGTEFEGVTTMDIIKRLDKKQPDKPKKKTYLMTESNTSYTKIGTSVNPTKRESTLQSQKPDIKLFAVSELDCEKELHNKFKNKRIRGEWFELSKDDIGNEKLITELAYILLY